MYEVRHYVSVTGKNVFQLWLNALKDPRTEARIAARLDRLVAGNFGDCKPIGDGVSELRINFGPGYRVYYAKVGRTCVLLLCAGDKRRQAVDIAAAIDYLKDYRKRSAKT